MNLEIEIDQRSGFCGGVIRAIGRAENYLQDNPGCTLSSLGAIVHNEEELSRLSHKGLKTIKSLSETDGGPVLIRAHGEPPSTYKLAEEKGIEIIDCTCPVVLQLQQEYVRPMPMSLRVAEKSSSSAESAMQRSLDWWARQVAMPSW